MILKLITYHFLFLNNGSTISIDFLWTTVVIFFIMVIVIITFILFYKSKLLKRFETKATVRTKLAPIISNFLFHSSQDSKNEQKEYVNLKIEIREYLKNRSFRRILASILFDLQKDVSGTIEERLCRLYRELDLHHDAFAKLESWRWYTIAKGIIELTHMNVDEAYLLIVKFINDKRVTVRKQAEIAVIKLRNEGVNYILDYTKYPISEWQQLKMIEALNSLKDYRPPKFKSWLISENKDVVLFSLRLIQHYNQNDAALSIIELVKHKNDQIKLAALQCIKDFHFLEAKPTLKNVFLNSSDTVKIKLLDLIGFMGDEKDLSFLNSIITSETNFLVASKAKSAINTITPDSILPQKDILNTQPYNTDLDIEAFDIVSKEIQTDEPTKVNVTEEYIEIETSDQLDVYELDKTFSTSLENIINENDKKELTSSNSFIDEETNGVANSEIEFLTSENDKEETLDEGILLEAISVFSPLYDKASDLNSKLILIEQMELIGEEKEITFLKSILDSTIESKINKAARKALKSLEKNNKPIPVNTDEKIIDKTISFDQKINDAKEEELDAFLSLDFKLELDALLEPTIETQKKNSNKLPLELCFLTDEFNLDISKDHLKSK